MATRDYFLKIEGIEGESSDSKHKGEIDVESIGWVQHHTVNHGTTHGSPVKVDMTDVNLTMFVSKASTKLMRACATGQPFEKATITLRKAGGDKEEFMKFILSDVRVSSYNIHGPANEISRPEKIGHEKGENPVPRETISLSFAEIEVEYREQKSAGNVGSPNRFRYNLKKAQVS
jgi:type VI secretion system secreted protein Hcp